MEVVNNNTDAQSIGNEFTNTAPLAITESLLRILSPSQKKLVEALFAHPNGLTSGELTQAIAVSNKSALLTCGLRMLLAKEGFEIKVSRVSVKWLWQLVPLLSSGEQKS